MAPQHFDRYRPSRPSASLRRRRTRGRSPSRARRVRGAAIGHLPLALERDRIDGSKSTRAASIARAAAGHEVAELVLGRADELVYTWQVSRADTKNRRRTGSNDGDVKLLPPARSGHVRVPAEVGR